ncbi:MAG: phospholipase D-like domain-containing protein [Phycisphaeraceae bacterium]
MWIAIIIVSTVLATVVVVLVVLNLTTEEKKLVDPLRPDYQVGEAQFDRSMGSLLEPPLIEGNHVQPLINGDEIFPAMLDAIRQARRTITMETYVYWAGDIGKCFADGLSERARAGVDVHVLLDWAGSMKMDHDFLKQMRAAGVEVEKYHPPRWYNLDRINNRTHRKLLIVDGRVGFTGGVGIADAWAGNADSPNNWRDTHFQVQGPVVAQMQAAFIDNWLQTHAMVLHGEGYFPRLELIGSQRAQMFKSSARSGSGNTRLMYLLSIAAATSSIRIGNAYFVPDDLSVQTFVEACHRGVDIEIIVPGPLIDKSIVRRASRARWGKLLEAGVRIYEYQPTMYHCKIMVVDEQWTSVGSTNFDNRSFRLNDEANLNVMDRALARDQLRCFEHDKQRSTQLTLEGWRNRPVHEKVIEHMAALLRAQV